MAAVAVTLLTRPPDAPTEPQELPEVSTLDDTLPEIGADAFEIVADTDRLLRACSCSASSDQVYNN